MHIEPDHSTMNTASPSGPERLDMTALCKYLGGTRPLHPSTVYRMVKAGTLPAPLKLGPKSNRWVKTQVDAALAKLTGNAAEAA